MLICPLYTAPSRLAPNHGERKRQVPKHLRLNVVGFSIQQVFRLGSGVCTHFLSSLAQLMG